MFYVILIRNTELICSYGYATSGNMDQLKIDFHKKRASGNFKLFIGKEGDYYVSVIPSLNISSFGDTLDEAKEFIKHALDDYFEHMFSTSEENIRKDLEAFGFKKSSFFKKKFQQDVLSNTYIDENGILQNFEDPTTVHQETITI